MRGMGTPTHGKPLETRSGGQTDTSTLLQKDLSETCETPI